jgi:RNA polymerase sigma-70 factor (ECF subfamily)
VERDFAQWYENEHPKVLGSLRALSNRVDSAAEATDEAFTRAFSHWPRVSTMASPGGWTYRVALHALRRASRRSQTEARLTAGQLSAVPPSVPEIDIELWEVVRALPDRQRTAIVLRYVADLSEADIAIAMKVRRGTVASTLTQARARLAVELRAAAPEPRSHHA